MPRSQNRPRLASRSPSKPDDFRAELDDLISDDSIRPSLAFLDLPAQVDGVHVTSGPNLYPANVTTVPVVVSTQIPAMPTMASDLAAEADKDNRVQFTTGLNLPPVAANHTDGAEVDTGPKLPPVPVVASTQAPVERRFRVRKIGLVQFALTPSERATFDAFWRLWSRQTQQTQKSSYPLSTVITIGFKRLGAEAGIHFRSCRDAVDGLEAKLILETLKEEDSDTRTGRTYRIYSYDETKKRWDRAGLTHIIKKPGGGIIFCTPQGLEISLQYKYKRATPPAARTQALSSNDELVNPAIIQNAVELATVSPTYTGPDPVKADSHNGLQVRTGSKFPLVAEQVIPRTGGESSPGAGCKLPSQSGCNLPPPPESILAVSLDIETSSSRSLPLSPKLVEGLQQFVPLFDNEAAILLWSDCRSRASDCTVEEVLHFTKIKAAIFKTGKIQNPTGFLLTTVPKCFEGQAFKAFREQETKRRAEQQRREEEELKRARTLEEELRAEEEAYSKAEEALATLSTEEYQELYQQTRREYLVLVPTAKSWTPEALDQSVRARISASYRVRSLKHFS